jgi:hypothetical protein
MQKTLIDPFELASRTLPAPFAAMAKGPQIDPVAAPQPPADEAAEEKPQPTRVPRAEAWARVRCWCSEE